MPTFAGTFRKTALLHQFFEQQSGAVLYCDATTYPLQQLEPLFDDIERGALYLHAPRRYPESDLQKALRKFTTGRDNTATTTARPAPARINVWHASVIGMNDQNKALLENLLSNESSLENSLATDYNFTKAFGEAGKIKSAAKYISDYGDFKEFSQLLETFFKKNEEESIPSLVKALHHIDAAVIQKQKEQFQQLPLLKKWLHTLTGKRWSIKNYENRW